MKRRLGLWSTVGSLAVAACVAAALVIVPIAAAGIAPGALKCPLTGYNPTKYGIQVSQTVTCTIVGASDVSGRSTVPVYVKSSDFGNSTVTGTVSGTTITFAYTAPAGGCNTVVVAYGSLGNNTNNSLLTAGGTAASGFALLNASGNVITVCGSPPPPPPTPTISLGYADNYFTHGSPEGLPWIGLSPAPMVLGCGVDPNGGGAVADVCPKDPVATTVDSYDAGAILIQNPSTTVSMPVTGGSVTIGSCVYNPWPGLNMSIPAGGSLVLTQTGGPNPCAGEGNVVGNYNFDTSESAPAGGICGVNDGLIPVVSLTINGTAMTINDVGQILNTGGQDLGDCGLKNEFHPFVQVSP